jgi:hypothetical protein
MVAPVPAQISKLLPRLPVAALRRPLPTLPTAHYLLPVTPFCAFCLPRASRGAPVSATSVLRFSPSSSAQARQLSCLHRFAASLSSLCALSCTRFLCFQQLAASFHKTPGWGVPRFPLRPPTARYPRPLSVARPMPHLAPLSPAPLNRLLKQIQTLRKTAGVGTFLGARHPTFRPTA